VAWLVRYKCHQCSAFREPGSESGWVRCHHCDALIAFDWQAWLASPAYRQYLSDSLNGKSTHQWALYQRALNEADAFYARSEISSASQKYRQAVGLMFDLLPGISPIEAHTNHAYRDRIVEYSAFLCMQRTHASVQKLNDEMLRLLKEIDYRNPLPTVLSCLDLLKQQLILAYDIGLPTDPDNMPLGARQRVIQSQFAGGYAQMMSAENQFELLQLVYGRDAVTRVDDAIQDDGLGMFREWTCPTCSLCSIQSRHVHEFTCLGCFFRIPTVDDFLPRIQTVCGNCAASIVLENGQIEQACTHCNSWVRRVRHDRSNELDFSNEVMRHFRAAVLLKTGQRITFEPLPTEGKIGIEVTAKNRESIKLQGFVRLVVAYQSFVPTATFKRLLQRSFSVSSPSELNACIAQLVEQATRDEHLKATEQTFILLGYRSAS
jgi:DNA-directed RNA polymerase subunit RPC12/RpoP